MQDALLFGAAGSVVTTATQGVDEGLTFAVGVLVGVGYLLLLEFKVDRIDSPSSGPLAGLGNLLEFSRFLLPVFFVLGLAVKNAFDHAADGPQEVFNLVPKDQFLAAILGFLSYRVPLLYSELKNVFTDDAVLEVLPGSIAKTVQMVKKVRLLLLLLLLLLLVVLLVVVVVACGGGQSGATDWE